MTARTERFAILTVCTMNICRSPAMAALVSDGLLDCSANVEFQVLSAGTNAVPGTPWCEISLAHAGRTSHSEASQLLTVERISHADVVFVAQADHARRIMEMAPGIPAIPIRAAARLSPAHTGVLRGTVTADSLRAFFAGIAQTWRNEQPRRSALPYGPDDVPDPHVLGINLHEQSVDYIRIAVEEIVDAVTSSVSARR